LKDLPSLKGGSKKVGSRRSGAAADLTIEENVLKKILQEKLCQARPKGCVERKQLMLRDKKTLLRSSWWLSY